jgi:putative tricarboxylic transport membrane protein
MPLTFSLEPATAVIMLAGVYYGAMFGGSTSAILLNVPGESSSVMTAVEGYPLARQGRGGVALGMSAVSSFITGTLAVVGLMFLAVPLTKFALALSLGRREAMLIIAILTLIAGLSGSTMLKGLAIGALGLVLATIGAEPLSAQTRLHFDSLDAAVRHQLRRRRHRPVRSARSDRDAAESRSARRFRKAR